MKGESNKEIDIYGRKDIDTGRERERNIEIKIIFSF